MSTPNHPKLHHVNLKTLRLQEMIDWYAEVVGMKANYQFPGGAWLTNDDANHRLALLAVPGLEDDPDKIIHTGIHHIAFEYGTMDEMLDNYVKLAPRGILPHACLDHGITTSFYYVDPDGNSVELQYDNFNNVWADSTKFMQGPEFDANPIGQNVDPELMVKARAEGADYGEIHRRAYTGEFEPAAPLDLRLPVAAPDVPVG